MNNSASESGEPRSLGLDLVRASAITLVMISHWSNNILYWFGIHTNTQFYFTGVLGVALFFALSGFLIGRILLREAERGASWKNFGVFLVRRWMRTLPLYFVVLVVLLIAFPPPDGKRLDYAIQFGTMTQNLWKEMPPGWWFSVSWSLTIEEWFYIFFGSAVFLSFRIFRARWASLVPLAAFLLIPLALRIFVPFFATYQIVLLRIDEIAYGVLMAVLYERRSKIFQYPFLCLAIGICFMLSAWTGYMPIPESLRNAFFYSVTMIGCALVIPAALRLENLPSPVSKIVRSISAQSYCLYLVHETILVGVAQELWGRKIVSAWVSVAIALILPFVISRFSYKYFEMPILARRPSHRAKGSAPSELIAGQQPAN